MRLPDMTLSEHPRTWRQAVSDIATTAMLWLVLAVAAWAVLLLAQRINNGWLTAATLLTAFGGLTALRKMGQL